jgi:hypothetical protein
MQTATPTTESKEDEKRNLCLDCKGPAEQQEGADLCFHCWYYRIRKTSPDFADEMLIKWYANTHLSKPEEKDNPTSGDKEQVS